MHPTSKLILKSGRDKPVRNRHPWIFSGAVARTEGSIANGDLVTVCRLDGEALGTAYYNQNSQIIGRILSFDPEQAIDTLFWQNKIAAAIERRNLLQLAKDTTAYRLINAEADGLPGLVVDRYGDYLVMQCLTLGIDTRKAEIAAILAEQLNPKGIIERSDVDVRRKEGLPKTKGVLIGEAPPAELVIQEHGVNFGVNLLDGQKTGLYLDQRVNRAHVCAPRFVQGKRVLNVFSYTGGFGVVAARNGAEVINIDSSVPALESAERNLQLNDIDPDAHEQIAADAFEILRDYRDAGRQFDVIILDPPKFIKSQRDLRKASRGYKDLNWLAMRLLRPNGLLASFSCSGLMSADLYQKIVFSAAVDAKRDAQIVSTLTQSPDHPVSITFPESAYLKGLLCRVF